VTAPQRVAIITGASQGMGAALVEACKLNYAVVANSRTITAADDPGVAAVAGDIAEPATAQSLVATAVERMPKIGLLVRIETNAEYADHMERAARCAAVGLAAVLIAQRRPS
jgi:NAD(P)-dependent dehydrogenase (short-subunit alcohol dehydrogenase family)